MSHAYSNLGSDHSEIDFNDDSSDAGEFGLNSLAFLASETDIDWGQNTQIGEGESSNPRRLDAGRDQRSLEPRSHRQRQS